MRVANIDVVNWNPRKFRIPGTRFRVGPRKENFGDLLGPMIVAKLLKDVENGGKGDHGPALANKQTGHRSDKKLLSVGSIVHFANDGDVLWGSGVNGKISLVEHQFEQIDVRAVRGPLTAKWLYENKGLDVPEVYGDPGLLVGELYPDLRLAGKSRKLTVIPNLNEIHRFKDHSGFVSPTAPLAEVLRAIAESELVVGSSLHAIVVADSLGVPSALVRSEAEPAFKYEDYFLGSGRTQCRTYADLTSALAAGSSLVRDPQYAPLADWNSKALIAAFPFDLWGLDQEIDQIDQIEDERVRDF